MEKACIWDGLELEAKMGTKVIYGVGLVRQHSWTDRMLFFLYTLCSTSHEVNLVMGGIIDSDCPHFQFSVTSQKGSN